MDARKAIQRAIETLISNRDIEAILNRTGQVRVPVLLDAPTTPQDMDATPDREPTTCVTFSIEETILGRRLMAEYQGYKEFVA
jgi:hypothetical protein